MIEPLRKHSCVHGGRDHLKISGKGEKKVYK